MIQWSDLPVPMGQRTGCLPRRSKFGKCCSVFADKIKPLPEGELDSISLTLRPFVKEVLSQSPAGSCATESTTGALMLARSIAGMPHVSLNPWFIYYHTGGQSDRGDGRSGGSSIDEDLEFARDNGVAPTSIWPRKMGWRTKPSEEAYEAAKQHTIEEFYDIATINEVRTAIVKGFPVVYGAKAHSVVKISTDAEDLNSWDTTWGDGGFGVWASFRAIDFRYGAFAVRVASHVERSVEDFIALVQKQLVANLA